MKPDRVRNDPWRKTVTLEADVSCLHRRNLRPTRQAGNRSPVNVTIPIAAIPPSAELVADKGYDSQALREWLEARGTQPVIPPRKNRKIQYEYDKTVYKKRNVIERMFCRLKDWRRIATRFDQNIQNFMSAIALAAAVIWWL
ncbi:IS5 family transposase [Neorhizobium galegae]|nr:IS5 family transposase [Neorhizobium galegae]